jgi:hypothetical protein
MAIIEKPTGPNEVFATPEEALQSQRPVMHISVEEFNETLASADVQATLAQARARQGNCSEEI